MPPKFKVDQQRSQIFEALATLFSKHCGTYTKLNYFRNPDQLRTNTNIKSGGLVLVTAVPLVNIGADLKGTEPRARPVLAK